MFRKCMCVKEREIEVHNSSFLLPKDDFFTVENEFFFLFYKL